MGKEDKPRRDALQAELDKNPLSPYGLDQKREGVIHRVKNAVMKRDDYGTELSAGATAARHAKQDEEWNAGKKMGEVLLSPAAKQAGREAAAEERREARGFKKGGLVRRGYGKARGA